MNRLTIVFIPGLSRGLFAQGAMPWLQENTTAPRRAGLVPSFPCLPETVEEIIREGLAGGMKDAIWMDRDDSILEAARRWGIDAPQRVRAAQQADHHLARHAGGRDRGDGWMIVGAPGLRPAGEKIDLSALAKNAEWRWKVDSAVLWALGPAIAGGARETVRDQLLHLRGIERVLWGESLKAWSRAGGPLALPYAADSELLVALACRGFSFEEEAASVGHPTVEESEQGLLLWIGPKNGEAWPAELHDFRIAPSLARALDREPSGAAANPFPL